MIARATDIQFTQGYRWALRQFAYGIAIATVKELALRDKFRAQIRLEPSDFDEGVVTACAVGEILESKRQLTNV